MGAQLEIAAIQRALLPLSRFPAAMFLSVNASPVTITSGLLEDAFRDYPLQRIILEITEHDAVADYSDIRRTLGSMREAGLRIAIDDAGAGYSGLRHMLDLAPDFIKLDISITRNIDSDPARRALAAALSTFCHETGCRIVAEGVETAAELRTLRQLKVEKVQGYLLGRPVALDQALNLATHSGKAKARVTAHAA